MPEYYDEPFLSEAEHAALNHSGVPGVGGSDGLSEEDHETLDHSGIPGVGGGGGTLTWTQILVNADVPVETNPIIIDTDVTSQQLSPDDFTHKTVTYIAASAGSVIQSILLTAWAPRTIDLVRVHLAKITDENGTFLAMPGSYSLQAFTSTATFDTVAILTYPAVAMSGLHFSFPDADNSAYNSTGSVITIKGAGHYRLGVDVHWLAPA